MRPNPGPHDIDATRAVFTPDGSVNLKTVTPTFFEELGAEFGGFESHILVSQFEFSEDWPTWEMHPRGDELVYLLSGRAEFILRSADGEKRIAVDTPGRYVIVPRGAWHTAKTSAPTAMLFFTPGEGTENREEPPL